MALTTYLGKKFWKTVRFEQKQHPMLRWKCGDCQAKCSGEADLDHHQLAKKHGKHAPGYKAASSTPIPALDAA